MSSYIHFTLGERIRLQELLFQGCSIRMIARSLGRSPSSVSREIKRNRSKNGYNHWRAHVLTLLRRRDIRICAIPYHSGLWMYVVEKLNDHWSPEQIASRWRLEHPDSRVGTATVYRYVSKGYFPDINRRSNLRRRGKRRISGNSNFNTIHPDRTIPEWPPEIKSRARIGDWEGDTVYGAVGAGLLVTMVDRKSRYLCAALLQNRDARLTKDTIAAMMEGHTVNSISLDNGSEFSEFKELERKLGVSVYFAESHKPWQRGTNENTNDILRYYFPKGFDFHSLAESDLTAVVDSINRRPRKCLGWRSPFEVYYGVALA